MTELEAALAEFLPSQRWFAGKGRAVAEVRVESSVPLRTALPSLSAVVAAVAYADGGVERYHVPVGHDRGLEARQLTDRAPDAVIHETKGPMGGPFYDAARDERLGALYLDLLSRAATVEELRFYRMPEWTETLRGPGKLLEGEQSNSSLVFGNRLILKLFRLLEPGENPELEVTRALAGAGFTACAAPLGWIEGLGSTLGILQRYYAGSVDGWKLATERVADHYESKEGEPDNFAEDAGALGRLTAELHAALAGALPKVAEGQPDLGRLSARLLGQLAQVAALVPELAGQRQAIEEVYTKAEAAGGGNRYLQRIHGDYHLGQVLKSQGPVDRDRLRGGAGPQPGGAAAAGQPAPGRGRHAPILRLRRLPAAGAGRGPGHAGPDPRRAGPVRRAGRGLDRGQPQRLPRRLPGHGRRLRLARRRPRAAAARV